LVSKLATDTIHDLARDPGGLLWRDASGTVWAVRLVAARHGSPGSYLGFAIGWRSPLPSKPKRAKQTSAEVISALRLGLREKANGLRLGKRAEQLLVAIHLAVVKQRRSVILLPDVMLRDVVWGGRRTPKNWQKELFDSLRSLLDLRAEILRLSTDGWRPQLGMESIAIATVEQLWVTRPGSNACRPACPLWGSDIVHRHYLIQAGYGFLGVMEKFVNPTETGAVREYDFTKRLKTEKQSDDTPDETVKSGSLMSISAPTALFGRASWSGITRAQQRLMQCLMGELTRSSGQKVRPDCALVFRGNDVPGRVGGQRVQCQCLEPHARYVAFCGNSGRREGGTGYLLVGESYTGWLFKGGYPIPEDDRGLLTSIRRFLSDLEVLENLLGIQVVGLNPSTLDWYDRAELRELANRVGCLSTLLSLHIRIYGPENYLERCREHFVEHGGFTCIAGSTQQPDNPTAASSQNLGMRLRLAGFSQTELARRLEVSQSFISQLEKGFRPWPHGSRLRAERLLQEVEEGLCDDLELL